MPSQHRRAQRLSIAKAKQVDNKCHIVWGHDGVELPRSAVGDLRAIVEIS